MDPGTVAHLAARLPPRFEPLLLTFTAQVASSSEVNTHPIPYTSVTTVSIPDAARPVTGRAQLGLRTP